MAQVFTHDDELYVVGEGHYQIQPDGDGGADIMFVSINGEAKPVAVFNEQLAAEEAYARAIEEAYSSANIIAILHLEMEGANS
jgi:hypothetical protein